MLKPGGKKQLNVQFQMNRLLFCQMHYAVDNMYRLHFVYPELHDLRRIELTTNPPLGCVNTSKCLALPVDNVGVDELFLREL